ncbi:MAG: DUF494 family protein [Ignavibacteria bacterium]|nr:DUF494 family protein [Ignavibacteria bacterium]MBK9228471.1 DUF494 family protein [Ignavibacteria bacterium]
MQEKVIEIIVLILNEMRNSKGLEEIDVKRLSNEGYTDAEINTAFAWIFSKIDSGDEILHTQEARTGSHRVYHPVEKKILKKDAIGYLIQLKELGILSDTDAESVIDRLLSAGYQKAGAAEVKMIVSSMLFDADNNSDLKGKLLLQNNDTIH